MILKRRNRQKAEVANFFATKALVKFRRVTPEGFEPSTISLKGCCSAVELRGQVKKILYQLIYIISVKNLVVSFFFLLKIVTQFWKGAVN